MKCSSLTLALSSTLCAIAAAQTPATSSPGDNLTDNSRLASVLPQGLSAQQACKGITSLDLCAATLHAAQNLGIPFADLKRQVSAGEGLDAAIHTLRPAADASAAATLAKQQALKDMRAPGP